MSFRQITHLPVYHRLLYPHYVPFSALPTLIET